MSQRQIEYQVERVLAEVERRGALHWEKLPRPSLMGKTAIVVDDGLASGFTMVVAVKSIQRQKAIRILAASSTVLENAMN